MPYTWQRPKPRTYTYNYQIQSAYYQPTLDNLDKAKKDPTAQTYAERIKKYPVYGGVYPDAAEDEIVIEDRDGRQDASGRREFYKPSSTGDTTSREPVTNKDTSAKLAAEKAKLQELEEKQFPTRRPIWQVHPFYLHEDTVRVPPREDSVWPESRPHFHLVSSYDLMVGYLGIRDMALQETEKLQRAQARLD
ncbi:uncharacterized protein LOC108680469 isoform X1 [Hyalella azteca]|uniref:Uncharacterized protein LOC108680469 isoform X1 n=1 Tax=Hyalella azteca TaxID=294128 RepID=A0A8B7PF72_HYAAZ|nr:uncharacterized protein LOC108680469 isoform X1 [Hyalella azteca]